MESDIGCPVFSAVANWMSEVDRTLATTVLLGGLSSCVPLVLVPFSSVVEGLLLFQLKGKLVACAYLATLPAPVITLMLVEARASEFLAFLSSYPPATASCVWILVVVYNGIKLSVLGRSVFEPGITTEKRLS